MSLAAEAATRLAARMLDRGWSLPPPAFRLRVDKLPEGTFVTMTASDGDSIVAERFRVDESVTHGRANCFIAALDGAALVPPHASMRGWMQW